MNHSVLIRQHGGPSVMTFESTAKNAPGPGTVLVRHEAIGVNFVDTMVRSGQFPLPLPTVLGFEAAGVVEAVGEHSTPFHVGDRVGYFFSKGAYADYNVVPTSSLIALPPDISSLQAAAFLAKGLTAWVGLRAMHTLQVGETVLVQGASGSVGSILSRWAKHLGATVIGVAGSPRKLEKVVAGASIGLMADDPLFTEKVRVTAPLGVDVVYDFVGAAGWHNSVASLRKGGTLLTIGAASGQPEIDLQTLAQHGIVVKGGGTPQYLHNPGLQATAAAELFDAIRRGIFLDLEIEQHPLVKAQDLHLAMEARRLNGLPVLIP